VVNPSTINAEKAQLSQWREVLPGGLQAFHGVPFRIDSPIAVTGMESARNGAFYPTEINLRIGGKAKRIHLLHGTLFADKDGV